jgi:hypothetical protein
MAVQKMPPRWEGSGSAIRAVQVAFDVEEAVLEAVRASAFLHNLSTSDQIRQWLGLSVSTRPKRPRLTVSLNASDYETLAQRYGLSVHDRLGIKEKVTAELIECAARGRHVAQPGQQEREVEHE